VDPEPREKAMEADRLHGRLRAAPRGQAKSEGETCLSARGHGSLPGGLLSSVDASVIRRRPACGWCSISLGRSDRVFPSVAGPRFGARGHGLKRLPGRDEISKILGRVSNRGAIATPAANIACAPSARTSVCPRHPEGRSLHWWTRRARCRGRSGLDMVALRVMRTRPKVAS